MSDAAPNTITPPVGSIVTFKGYADLQGQEPILTAGERVVVHEIKDDGSIVVHTEGAEPKGETIFPEEIDQIISQPEAVTVTADEAPAEATKAKAKGGKKGKAKTEVQAAPAETPVVAAATEAPAAEATTKGKKGKKITVVEPAPEPVSEAVVETQDASAPAEVQDSDAVRELLEHQDALEAARTLRNRAEESFFSLGGVLNHIQATGAHKAAGFDGKRGFADYVKTELDIDYRKAMYLIDIYKTFRALGIDETQFAGVGWSKAKELTGIATPENIQEVLSKARELSKDALISWVRDEFVTEGTEGSGSGGTRVRRIRLNFALFEDQAETVNRAIEAGKAKVGNDDLAQALEYICAEWLQTAEGVDVPLEDALRHLEAKYGVRLATVEGEAEAEGQVRQAA